MITADYVKQLDVSAAADSMAVCELTATMPNETININNNNTSKIQEFYNGRSVLITGGSGFIGKVLIEKILRTCPEIGGVFTLIRPKRNKSPAERLSQLLDEPLFDQVRERVDSKGTRLLHKVRLVEGDVEKPALGLSVEAQEQIIDEVSIIYHSAATVKFDEPLKQSIGINMTGVLHMIELCRRVKHLAALVHVSTAYANCDRPQIDEHIYPVDSMPDPTRLVELASWLDQDTLQELKRRLLGPRPNTYTYTKALAEWMLTHCAQDLPIVICRPSIVIASWREPFAGWIDNFNGPTGVVLALYKGIARTMMVNVDKVADLVPVDTVSNMIVALGWFAHVHRESRVRAAAAQATAVARTVSSSSSSSSSDVVTVAADGSGRRAPPPPAAQIKSPALSTADSILGSQSGGSSQHASDTESLDGRTSSAACSLDAASASGCASDGDDEEEEDAHGAAAAVVDGVVVDQINNEHKTKRAVISAQHSNKDIVQRKQQVELDFKLNRFHERQKQTLAAKGLPTHLADIPVFHCTSGRCKPITWGFMQMMMFAVVNAYPSIMTFRCPGGSLTNIRPYDFVRRWIFHYTPAYLLDLCMRATGRRPFLMRIYSKFDQASEVLEAFTMHQWDFSNNNRLAFINEFMSTEDRRLFNCDLSQLNWVQFMTNYALGVRKFLLKEQMHNLEQARSNHNWVYYRNTLLEFALITLPIYLCTHSPIVTLTCGLAYMCTYLIPFNSGATARVAAREQLHNTKNHNHVDNHDDEDVDEVVDITSSATSVNNPSHLIIAA